MANNYAYGCPHKDRHTRVCVCVCVCMLGLIDESYRTACSTGGIITAGVEQLRSRLFAMSHTHLLARTHAHTHARENEHMHDATVHQQSEGTPSSCLLQRDGVTSNCSTTPESWSYNALILQCLLPKHQL